MTRLILFSTALALGAPAAAQAPAAQQQVPTKTELASKLDAQFDQADSNNDGCVDGYMRNGQYYEGVPSDYQYGTTRPAERG